MEHYRFAEKQQDQLRETTFELDGELEYHEFTPTNQHIDVLVANIKYYLSFPISDSLLWIERDKIKLKLKEQLLSVSDGDREMKEMENFNEIYKGAQNQQNNIEIEKQERYKRIDQFGRIMKRLIEQRNSTKESTQFENLTRLITKLTKQIQTTINEYSSTFTQFQNNHITNQPQSYQFQGSKIQESEDWLKQKIKFISPNLSISFDWIEPQLHRIYVSEAAHCYDEIVPFKIKVVCLDEPQQMGINTNNYFCEGVNPERAVIHYCKPGTKTLITYRLEDICNLLTIQKQYAIKQQLPIRWTFSKQTRTIITPDGRIFGINCRTTQTRQDCYMYEIYGEKVSNRGKLPYSKRQSGFVYCNKAIYVIGGSTDEEICSMRNFKYSLKDNKWRYINNSNIALKKPTVCSFRDRYIIKIGGITQFQNISKAIQIYDTTTGRWSMIRANMKNVSQEVPILQDSLAVQISQNQIYVFAGKNENNYQTNTAIIIEIDEIKQKIKAPLQVDALYWNASVKKKNLISFFGLFSQSNPIVHNQCLYAIRAEESNFWKL